MTLRELYDALGGSYDDAVGRLRSERLVSRMVQKFPNDTSCERAISAWEAGDTHAAFEAAHEAKGVCSNLYLIRLQERASAVCEALRPGSESLGEAEVDGLVEVLREEHAATVSEIARYVASL